ncbi:AT-rich interactive domain-containing protein 5B [Eufriesea mexicana]|uniref:AT-rich interactive domain-containing protein 5B n=1 Tax=Eufriesea mexicana TaxID=516756 RepID=A0A310ST72_9HYME|nr:AT-rich interactive domain-containing protein 5B [Eufriesea mexicana]
MRRIDGESREPITLANSSKGFVRLKNKSPGQFSAWDEVSFWIICSTYSTHSGYAFLCFSSPGFPHRGEFFESPTERELPRGTLSLRQDCVKVFGKDSQSCPKPLPRPVKWTVGGKMKDPSEKEKRERGNVEESILLGGACFSHGPYTFYKAVRIGNGRVLRLGSFFLTKLWSDADLVSIGELQLLWMDSRGPNQPLASLRLYFLPENTPDGRRDTHGEVVRTTR